MTREQRAILDLIAELTVDDVSPSLDELRVGLGLRSKSNVQRLLVSLKDQGLIDWRVGRARSIRLIADSPAYTPAALGKLDAEALRRLIVTASGVLAHRTGGGRDGSGSPPDRRPPDGSPEGERLTC